MMATQARSRLLLSAVRLGQRDGWSKLSVADVLKDSGVARRSFYAHFPDGAGELTLAAVEVAAEWITAVVQGLAELESREALDVFVEHWVSMLESSDFLLGCPVAAAAASRPQHPEAANLAERAFARWEELIAEALVRDGIGAAEAAQLGLFVVMCVEGAVVRCMSAQSIEPMRVVRNQLRSTLDAALG